VVPVVNRASEELMMIKRTGTNMLWALICLSLMGCIALQSPRERGPGSSEVTVARTATINKETGADPAVTAVAEAAASDGDVTAPAAIMETAPAGPTATETLVPIPDDDIVYAQKRGETLALPGCYDFDEGASLTPPDSACDFSMLPGPDGGTIEVYPQGGATLAYSGVFPEEPTRSQCATNDAYSSEREIVAPMAAMYVCYQTAEGRMGYLHFTAADLETAGTLTFDWVTFTTIVEEDVGAAAGERALTYDNDAFGFGLTLPATWNGFQASEHTSGEDELPDVGTVCFTFADHGPFCILKVDVWSPAEWRRLEKVPDGYYLGESDQYVFAAGPYGLECVQLDSFQCERRREVPDILAGLSFDAE
jgi:hypothetical protein